MGRPSDYTPDIAETICRKLASGMSLRAICREPDMPGLSAVCVWLSKHPSFAEQYAHAREFQAEAMFEEIFDIADDGKNDVYLDDEGNERTNHDVIARSRLRVDTRKWALARMAPKKYGEKQTIENKHSGGIELRDFKTTPEMLENQKAAKVRFLLKNLPEEHDEIPS